MKIKKIGFNLTLGTLTVGASAILAFLSFSGMLALWPIIPLAIVTFILSVAYEGEIYLQNIRKSLTKLLKRKYIELSLANEYLLNHFPDTTQEDCPQFFKDYEQQLKVLGEFGHHNLDDASRARKLEVEKKLRKMERWFSVQIFTRKVAKKKSTGYRRQLQDWLNKDEQKQQLEDLMATRKKRSVQFTIAKVFSVIAGLFMMVGSSYLLVAAFAAIPVLASLPFTFLPIIVVPLAIIAGAAYTMLIYNAVTSMIENQTLRKWYDKIRNIRDDWRKGEYVRSILIVSAAIVLVALAVTLTVLTAGTWWTIAQNARPIFEWMSKIPAFVMGIINPIVIGISSIIFNFQNTSETIEMLDEATRSDDSKKDKPNIFVRFGRAIKKGFESLRAKENWLQIFNPFRILIKITLAPLRILLFIGHLISMGVTDDRMPGIPQLLAAILGTVSEIFEDLHYYPSLIGVGHDHHHGHSTNDLLKERHDKGHSHSHDNDLPARFLNFIFIPLFFLAALWDSFASQSNPGDKHAVDKLKHDEHKHDKLKHDEHKHDKHKHDEHKHCKDKDGEHKHGKDKHHKHKHDEHKHDKDKPKVKLGFVEAWKKHWGIKEERSIEPKNLHPVSAKWENEEKIQTEARHKLTRSNNAAMVKELSGATSKPGLSITGDDQNNGATNQGHAPTASNLPLVNDPIIIDLPVVNAAVRKM